jgi:hypothetical protein
MSKGSGRKSRYRTTSAAARRTRRQRNFMEGKRSGWELGV